MPALGLHRHITTIYMHIGTKLRPKHNEGVVWSQNKGHFWTQHPWKPLYRLLVWPYLWILTFLIFLFFGVICLIRGTTRNLAWVVGGNICPWLGQFYYKIFMLRLKLYFYCTVQSGTDLNCRKILSAPLSWPKTYSYKMELQEHVLWIKHWVNFGLNEWRFHHWFYLTHSVM